ncbi:hypothetical protein CR203_12110 [Salipaludibacillus neizhouensis]|uniref:General stress protein n=1 Tax=Salipaludibacillus neizhouensis TaxID=885475 RepID=A0A3A9KHT6_9BACI|nr:DUF948 domain-containing protein [Salipaludibacillus neizhouensis]RKL67245.1 hypothetical protein CR203_12110 [Salipaludibacillus neizhouensis]
MDWLGIGVFILSLAFAALVILLIPVFKKLTETLGHTAETVESVNKTVGEVSGEATVILHNVNETLMDVNEKIAQLNPLFKIVHDTGESAHHLTSTMVKFTSKKADHAQAGTDILDRNNLEGILRGAAFIYYLRQAKKDYDHKNA